MNIITKIQCNQRNKERVSIFIDEEFAFSINAELVYKENLAVKQSIDIDKIKRLAEEDDYIKCKNSALRILERTHKTTKEIFAKLKDKEYEDSTINKTILFLKEYNLINDDQYAKLYIKEKVKAQGKNKIKFDLIRKGINSDIVERELSNIDEDNLLEKARELALKKYNVLAKRESDKYKLSQKIYRFLITKGYDYDIVSSVVKEVVNSEELY